MTRKRDGGRDPRRRDLSRRDFLRVTTAAMAASACTGAVSGNDPVSGDGGAGDPGDGGSSAPDAAYIPPEPRDLQAIPASAMFGLGVMAGDATADRAMAWTRYTGSEELRVHVQEEGGPPVWEAVVEVAGGGFAHADVAHLRPGAWYEYAFLEVSPAGEVVGRSAIGRFRAAVDPDALETVTFGATSCTAQKLDNPNQILLRAAARTDLSFFLHAGDHLYADHSNGQPDDAAAVDLPGYHGKYAFAWARPGLRALHQAFGMYVTWDDHEVFDNWQGYRDEPRINAGVQAFFEHQPIRRTADAPRRLWRSFRWGRTLELFVLDCRGERDLAAGKYISDQQLDWLAGGLSSSPAVFKFVLNSCPIGIFPADTIDRWRSPDDRWANPAWSAQRTRILDVAQEAGGVWWLSGDFHFGTVGRVAYPNTDRHTRVREVVMGAGGQGLGSSDEIPGTTRITQIQNLDNSGAHWTFATPKNNYVIIRAHPEPDETHAKPWLDIAFYDATSQLGAGQYELL